MAEHTWHLKSGLIDELVRAADQHEAYDTLRHRPLKEFGLIVTAEPDESGDPIAIRTSALMFSWGRDQDAEDCIRAARFAGLADTTALDQEWAAERGTQRG